MKSLENRRLNLVLQFLTNINEEISLWKQTALFYLNENIRNSNLIPPENTKKPLGIK